MPPRDDDFSSQIRALRVAMDEGFKGVYEKIDRVDEKVVSIQVETAKSEEKMAGMTSRCSDHHIRTEKLETWKESTERQLTSWKGSLKVIIAIFSLLQAACLVALGAALSGWRP